MKTCVTCGLPKQEDEFNWRYKALNIRQKSCRDCQHGFQSRYYKNHIAEEKERTRQRKVRTREAAHDFVYNYLLAHPCRDCGETDPNVLEFDHVRGKAATVGRLISEGASIPRLKIEIALTVVRCANCHRRKTAKERGWFRDKL